MKTLAALMILAFGTTATAQYSLTLNMLGMNPHVGQIVHVRIVNMLTSKESGNVEVPVNSPSESVTIMGLQGGMSYNVDFYADVNMNGMYDAPPTDHTWRRVVMDITDDVTVNFQHDTYFVDIQYPNRLPIQPIRIAQTWSGTWYSNTTVASGPASASFAFDAVNNTMTGSVSMDGSIGTEVPLTITGSGYYNAEADSAEMILNAPVTGTWYFVKGRVYGTATYADFGVDMTLAGNYGADVMTFTYNVSGLYSTNGWTEMSKQIVSDVVDEYRPLSSTPKRITDVYPQPAINYVVVAWDSRLGQASKVSINGVLGYIYEPLIIQSEKGMAVLDVSTLPTGAYGVVVFAGGTSVNAMLLK